MNTKESLQSALEQYQAGNLELAKNICMEMVISQPENADVLHLLGLIWHKLGDLDMALKNIRKAIKADPDYADAYFDLGNILQEAGEVSKAITQYKKAIKLRPNYAEAYNNMGIVLQDDMKLDKAIQSYREAIRIDACYAEAYNNLGVAFQEKKQLDEAVTHFQKALLLKPDYGNAYHNLVDAIQGKEYEIKPGNQKNGIYAVYRCLFGEDFVQESIKSIRAYVDKIFIFWDDKPQGNITECIYKGETIKFPKKFDNVLEKIKELNDPKVELIYDHQDSDENYLTHFVNDIILPKYRRPSTILYLEVDHIFHSNQIEKAIDEFREQDYLFATTESIELWKDFNYRLPERTNKVGAVFCNLNRLSKMPMTLKHGGIAVMPRLSSYVHSFGFAVSEKSMYWKHLLSIATSRKFGGDVPFEEWYEEKWLKWDYEANNENLDISEQQKISWALPYNAERLPEVIQKKYC
jgi:tetratricopeptide (TPR) repeat protein